MSEYLNGLNPSQKEAVLTTDGALLVLAGAGSGKTRVITHRIAHIIASGLASPEEILAVTFTNKAAREMEERVHEILGSLGIPVFRKPWISTFHAMGVRILRDHASLLGYQPQFSIYDRDDQLKAIKATLARLHIDEKRVTPKAVSGHINKFKSQGLSPDDLENQFVGHQKMDYEIYKDYEQQLKLSNAFDFGDLLLKPYVLFKKNPEVLKSYQDSFQYIHVDEYQDTNLIQYQLMKLLAQTHKNLCVVGDEDQSIYSWRGAEIGNIFAFEQDFKSHFVKLETNYRSTKNIVLASNSLIKNNLERKNKVLNTENAEGDKITISELQSEYDEARYIAGQVHSLLSGAHAPKDIAIFYRTNAQSRVLEDQLRSRSIPYKIVGGMKFYERKEIKDVISYIKLCLNPNDDVAFRRVLNTPKRGIGKTTLSKLENLSFQLGVSLFESCSRITSQDLKAAAHKKILGFYQLIQSLRAELNIGLTEFYLLVLEQTQYLSQLKSENTQEAQSRIQNLEELSNAMTQFEKERTENSIQDFLEEMALISDLDQTKDIDNSVTLMTIHISKGLEFPVVFISGMEEGLFPSIQKVTSSESELEEERRLCYVAMTRAKKKLYATYALRRKVWGRDQFNPPSRFLSEIPEEFVEYHGQRPNRPKYDSFNLTKSNDNSYASPKKQDHFPSYEDQSQMPEVIPGALCIGAEIRHPVYGTGQIQSLEGEGEHEKVQIQFRNHVVKKFLTKYAQLEILS